MAAPCWRCIITSKPLCTQQILQYVETWIECCAGFMYPGSVEVLQEIRRRLTDETTVCQDYEQQSYVEPDGCPTEVSVLQRYWRKNETADGSDIAGQLAKGGPLSKPTLQAAAATIRELRRQVAELKAQQVKSL